MINSKARRAEKSVTKSRPWWIEQSQKNPIAVLTAMALTCGGLILMGFFLRIGFMPDVDLTGSTALLLAAALVGLGSICATIFVLVVPGITSRYMMDTVHLKFGKTAFAFAAVPGVLCTLLVVGQAIFPTESPIGQQAMPFVIIALAVLASLLGARFASDVRDDEDELPRASYLYKVWAFGASALMWTLGILTALGFALKFAADSDHGTWLVVLLVCSWLIFIIGVNAMTARLPIEQAWRFGPVMSLLSLIILVLLTGSFTTFSATTVQFLGFGEIKDVDLILTSQGCQALRLSAASDLRCAGGTEGGDGILRNVTLRSRIGSQIVVEKSGAKSSQGGARVVMKKEDVAMWEIRIPAKPKE